MNNESEHKIRMEIERKFLIKNDGWRVYAANGVRYTQGYLNKNGNTVRVRVAGDKGILTIKSKSKGISRMEYEYEIPLNDAQDLMTLSQTPIIDKIRYKIPINDHIWEVDEFLGENEGLIIVEVEVNSEDEYIELPEWVGLEVSGDKRYYNSHLAEYPYSRWTDNEKACL